MKHCNTCDTSKNTSEFYKNKSKSDGLTNKCKSCSKGYSKGYHNDHRETRLEVMSLYKENNQESIKSYRTKYKLENSELITERKAAYRKRAKDVINANNTNRRAAQLQRTAPWANLDAIRAFYTEAQRLTNETGVVHHVDHILPLQGTSVSGLHIETNLQILTATENLSKSNKYETEE